MIEAILLGTLILVVLPIIEVKKPLEPDEGNTAEHE